MQITYSIKNLVRKHKIGFWKENKVEYKVCELHHEEKLKALYKKLAQQSQEAECAQDKAKLLSELASILDVVTLIAQAHNLSFEDILEIQKDKLSRLGTFEVFVEEVKMSEINPVFKKFNGKPNKYPVRCIE